MHCTKYICLEYSSRKKVIQHICRITILRGAFYEKVFAALIGVICLALCAACAGPSVFSASQPLSEAQVQDLRETYPIISGTGGYGLMSVADRSLEMVSYEGSFLAVIEIVEEMRDITREIRGETMGLMRVSYQLSKMRIRKVLWTNTGKGAPEGEALKEGGEYTLINSGIFASYLPDMKAGDDYVMILTWNTGIEGFEDTLGRTHDAIFYLTSSGHVLSSFSEENKKHRYSGMALDEFAKITAERFDAWAQGLKDFPPIEEFFPQISTIPFEDLPPTPIP